MKLRSQIVVAQLPSVLIIVLITIFFVFALMSIEKKSEAILLDNFKSILAMQRFQVALEELHTINVDSLTGDEKDIKTSKELDVKIAKQLITLEEIPEKQPEQENVTSTLRQNWEAYKEVGNNPLIIKQELDRAHAQLKESIRRIIDYNLDELMRKKSNLSIFIYNMLVFVALGPALILIFSFFASWYLTGLLLNPLDKMAAVMREIGVEGSRTLIKIKGSDEIEKLSEEFNLMTHRLDEYHRSSLGHVLRDYHTLKSGIDCIPSPIILLSSKKDIIFSNQSAQKVLGISENNQTTNPFATIDEGSQDVLNNIINTVLMTKAVFIPDRSNETISLTFENKRYVYLPLIYPIRNVNEQNGSLDGIFIFLEDLTRQQMSDLSKTEVYETLLHEFQSPLSDVHMAIHTCVQEVAGPLTPKQQEILYAARRKCETLEKLCQDLLNYSQINQLTVETGNIEVNLTQVVTNLIESLKLEILQKELTIHFQEPPFLSPITSHQNQIEILFDNLIRNALQFAEPSTVITIQLRELKNAIEFSVNNEGSFIPLEHHKNVFKKYFKVPGSSSDGAGLGLYIAKQITNSIGAKIGFKSTEMRGTTFWVHFPLHHELNATLKET
jgi:signal transduction histidine kinase/HAMP domain-containing protein